MAVEILAAQRDERSPGLNVRESVLTWSIGDRSDYRDSSRVADRLAICESGSEFIRLCELFGERTIARSAVRRSKSHIQNSSGRFSNARRATWMSSNGTV